MLVEEKSQRSASIQNMKSYAEKVDEYLKEYEAGIITETDRNQFDAITPLWESYKTIMNQVIDYLNGNHVDKAESLVLGEMAAVGNSLQSSFENMFIYNTESGKIKSEENQRLLVLSIILMAVVVCISIAAAISLGQFNNSMIGKPMTVFSSLAKMIALGDIAVEKVLTEKDRLLTRRKDEVGDLANAFEQMIDSTTDQVKTARRIADGDLTADVIVRSEEDVLGKSIRDLSTKLSAIVETIVTAAEQVAAGSNLIADSSNTLSEGSTEQASSVEELTASLQQIAAQIVQNNENAKTASVLAKDAESKAESGNRQMQEMLGAMNDISESSKNINKIIKVIDDIAFQTNILALNAAVEAARAGMHGKGFAVVAEEVRNLAARSASAAKETTEMIEDSIKKVEAGRNLANKTAEALHQIVEQVQKAAELVNAIAVASSEQSVGVEQVNQGTLQISQVVQANAASAEEIAAASEELSSQAAQLKEAVGVFKLK